MNKATQGNKRTQTVPVQLKGGLMARVNPQDIPSSKWDHHHGKTADGQQVNSLRTAKIDDSILIRNGEGGPTFSTTIGEFEVAAVQILSGIGYDVKAPAGH